MKNIQQAPIQKGTKVFIRLDMDVPIVDGNIGETYRLEAGLPTIKYVLQQGGIPVLAGHMGQPEGVVDEKLSTKQLLPYFNQHLGENNFELLENLRFNTGEEENSPEYSKELASKADIYVNESFATSHRKHASIVGIPSILPSFAGLRLQKEITILEKVKKDSKKPFIVIIGGAKLESKLPVIDTFLKLSDAVLIGGKLGIEWENLKKEIPGNLYIPTDYAQDKKDIGSETIKKFVQIISTAKTILWAGPLGLYEDPQFITGTKEISEAITNNKDVWSIIGGGDTVAAVSSLNLLDKFNFASTGGGAMLEFLAKDTLPGIEALQ